MFFNRVTRCHASEISFSAQKGESIFHARYGTNLILCVSGKGVEKSDTPADYVYV